MDITAKKQFFCQLPLVWQKLIISNISNLIEIDSSILDIEFANYRKEIEETEDYILNKDLIFKWKNYDISDAVTEQITRFYYNSSYNFETTFYNNCFFPTFSKLRYFGINKENSSSPISIEKYYSTVLPKYFSRIDHRSIMNNEVIEYNEYRRLRILNDYLKKVSKPRNSFTTSIDDFLKCKAIDPREIARNEEIVYADFIKLAEIEGDLRNIDPLILFENIEEINLPACNISDLMIINELKTVKKIVLRNNPIRDIKQKLKLPNLYYLDLSKCLLTNVSKLSTLRSLTQLYLGNNPISCIDSLSKHKNLRTLDLNHCILSNITGIGNLTNLVSLNLSNNNISSFVPISKLGKLKHLDLFNCKISNFSGLEKLIRLNHISISNNPIKIAIKPLNKLLNLEYLSISDCKLNSASFLRFNVKMKALSISRNNLSNIKFLRGYINLEQLEIENNKILTLNGLNSNKKLKWFDCSNNLLTSLDGIEKSINSIEVIRFGGMTIDSMRPLMKLKEDSEIYIGYYNTTIKDEQSERLFFNTHKRIDVDNDRTRSYLLSQSRLQKAIEENELLYYDENDSDRDYFDAMTDGKYGNFDDYTDAGNTVDDLDELLGN